jgi:hypothetical protein
MRSSPNTAEHTVIGVSWGVTVRMVFGETFVVSNDGTANGEVSVKLPLVGATAVVFGEDLIEDWIERRSPYGIERSDNIRGMVNEKVIAPSQSTFTI